MRCGFHCVLGKMTLKIVLLSPAIHDVERMNILDHSGRLWISYLFYVLLPGASVGVGNRYRPYGIPICILYRADLTDGSRAH